MCREYREGERDTVGNYSPRAAAVLGWVITSNGAQGRLLAEWLGEVGLQVPPCFESAEAALLALQLAETTVRKRLDVPGQQKLLDRALGNLENLPAPPAGGNG